MLQLFHGRLVRLPPTFKVWAVTIAEACRGAVLPSFFVRVNVFLWYPCLRCRAHSVVLRGNVFGEERHDRHLRSA